MDAYNVLISFIFLGLLSVVEIYSWRKKQAFIPSIFTYIYLLLAFIGVGQGGLYVGILALIIGLILSEFQFIKGYAELKIYIASSVMFPFENFLLYTIVLCIVYIVYRLIMHYILREEVNIPIIPTFLVAFLLTFSLA